MDRFRCRAGPGRLEWNVLFEASDTEPGPPQACVSGGPAQQMERR